VRTYLSSSRRKISFMTIPSVSISSSRDRRLDIRSRSRIRCMRMCLRYMRTSSHDMSILTTVMALNIHISSSIPSSALSSSPANIITSSRSRWHIIIFLFFFSRLVYRLSKILLQILKSRGQNSQQVLIMRIMNILGVSPDSRLLSYETRALNSLITESNPLKLASISAARSRFRPVSNS